MTRTSSHHAVPNYVSSLGTEIRGLRLGVDERFIRDGVKPEVSSAVMQAVKHLVELGLDSVEVVVPSIDPQSMMNAWSTLCAADAADAHRQTWPERAEEYGPFRQWLEFADTLTGSDYAAAHATRLEYSGKIVGLFETIDLLVCPAMPVPPPQIGFDGLPVPDESYVRPRFTYPFNFSNSPTLTLPCGFTEDNLPIALQLVGPHFSEETLLNVGHMFETSTVWHTRVPPT